MFDFLPASIICVEGMVPAVSDILPQEESLAQMMGDTRRQEFIAGRTYAREALRRLGADTGALLTNEDRSPCWPNGIVGSITHAADRCAAAVARSENIQGLGIDIERIAPDAFTALENMFGDDEAFFLKGIAEGERAAMTCLLLSAKESYFKMQYPMTGRWMEFDDVTVRVIDGDRFEIRQRSSGDAVVPGTVRGYYRFRQDFVYTAIYISR